MKMLSRGLAERLDRQCGSAEGLDRQRGSATKRSTWV